MSNVKVSMSKKGVLIGLIVLVLVLGGGGGYLLWRVNQKDTVAPTDSSASGGSCNFYPIVYYLRDGTEKTCQAVPADSSLPFIPGQISQCRKCITAATGVECGSLCLKCPNAAEACRNIDNPPPTYTLTYIAGDGGSIEGVNPQKIQKKKSGTEVTAKPNSGFKFVKWNDENTSASRTETNVQADATYTATFEALPVETVTLRYIAEPTIGGEIRGKTEQTVEKGKDGEQVVATPKAGYEFVKWEDNGSTVSSRQDTNVQGNITGKAIFQKAEAPVTCGDGICSEGENPLNCPQDCSSVCGDGMCTEGETSLNCPEDCGAPPAGKVPDTAIFDDTKDTIIFGMAILLVGMAWTWISTLPKKAYTKISKVSSEYITEAKLTRERNTRESRRNRLERRIK